MQDFTRIIPKHKYEEWPDKLGRMSELFHQAEHQMVKKKLRKVAIVRLDPNNLQSFLEKINRDRLIFTPLKKESVSAGFSALSKPVEPGQPFIWQGCLTRTYKDSQKFKKADSKNDHQTIGQMLGYPDCCIDYFIRTFPIDPVPIWVDLKGKVRGFPECNGMLRYFGPRIVAHLSCSPLCQATKEIGKTWFKVMQEIDKDLANELYDLLASPITWDSYHGVVQIETPYFVGLNKALFILKKPRIIKWSVIKEKQKPLVKKRLKAKIRKAKSKKNRQ